MTDDAWQPPARGALDDTAWPEKLVARAIEPGSDDDRLHGYAVVGDLAKHYELSEVLYLAIVGELPNAAQANRFRVALISLAAIGVNEAPTHVALLSRICAGAISSALGAGLVVAADQARFKLEANWPLFAWLANPVGPPPDEVCSRDPDDARWVVTLRRAAPDSTLVHDSLSRDAARIALLYDAGLREPAQIEAAFVASRVCGIAAEALRAGPKDLGSYPVKLPPFHYVEDEVA